MDCNVRFTLEELRYVIALLEVRNESLKDDESSLLSYIDLIQSNDENGAKDEILDLLSIQRDIELITYLIKYLKTFDKYSYLRGIL